MASKGYSEATHKQQDAAGKSGERIAKAASKKSTEAEQEAAERVGISRGREGKWANKGSSIATHKRRGAASKSGAPSARKQ